MFHQERERLLATRTTHRESFTQLLGEHAVGLCELAMADQRNHKKGLMKTWVDIHKLNDEWAHLVTRNDHPEAEFTKITHRLVHLYSEAMAGYILDKASGPEWREKIGELVNTEQKFFDALGKGHSGSKQWVAYTGSVIQMVNALLRYGEDGKGFDIMATECVKNGKLLGNWLDYSLK